MGYDEKVANLTRELIAVSHKKVEEKKMFGGICFMVNDKMCIGVNKDRIMVRIDPAVADKVIENTGSTAMVHNGRVMKGFVFVRNEEVRAKKKLEYWVKLALDYNKTAKSSKSLNRKPLKKSRLAYEI